MKLIDNKGRIVELTGSNLRFLLVVFSSLYYFLLIHYGFDVTDTGYHLAKQNLSASGFYYSELDNIVGTNIIGGLWLLISGTNLYFARTGFIVVQVLILILSYNILKIYFCRYYSFVVLLSVWLPLSLRQHYFTINYDNLPLLFLIFSFYLILKKQKNQNQNKIQNILAGVFISLSVLSKITYIVSIPLVVLYFLDNSRREMDVSKKVRYVILGMFTSTVILITFFWFFGWLGLYISNLFSLFSESAQFDDSVIASTLTRSLTWIYRSQINEISMSFIKCLLTIIVFTTVREKIKAFKSIHFIWVSISGWVFFYTIFEPSGVGVISFMICLLFLWILASSEKHIREYGSVIFLIISLFIISFFGSNLGIYAGIRSGSLILPVSFLLLLTKYSVINIGSISISFRYLLPLSVVLFFVYFVSEDFRPYQDMKFEKLTTKFSSPQLKGIRSNPARVAVVDSLLSYLNDIPDLKDKDIYFAKHSPMYYYLTGTKYRLDSPWDTLNRLEDVKADFDRQAPELIVLPKGSHRNYMWPNDQKVWENEGGEIKVKPYYEFYDSFIKENNYIEVYKNSFYTVYQLKFEGGMNESSAQQY